MTYPNIHLENQLKTFSNKVKVTLPKNIRKYFPYTLIVQGVNKNNKYWIQMQMYKSQHENPIKIYHWKKDTDIIQAITYLASEFIKEYRI
jgi:hypothetical protein